LNVFFDKLDARGTFALPDSVASGLQDIEKMHEGSCDRSHVKETLRDKRIAKQDTLGHTCY
jgi:hypothetical protein